MTGLPVVLVDGTSYVFRAFYALPPLTMQNGQPTGAIAGFAQMIHKLLQDYPKSPVIVFFDAGAKTHRHSWHLAYKENRSAPPEDLVKQFEPIKEIVRALGLPLICHSGTEADDLIACVARHYQSFGEVIICSPDKDFTQLIGGNIILENPIDQTRLSEVDIQKKYGVTVAQLPEYFALLGDSSDNIPGVPKIGSKTAQKLIHQYESLEGLYHNVSDIKGVVGANLIRYRDDAFLSRKLFLFQTVEDLGWPIELPFDHAPVRISANILEAAKVYEKYELRRLLARLPIQHMEQTPYATEALVWATHKERIHSFDGVLYLLPIGLYEWELGYCDAHNIWQFGGLSTEEARDALVLYHDALWVSFDWKAAFLVLQQWPQKYHDLHLMLHMAKPDVKPNWIALRASQKHAHCDTMALSWLWKSCKEHLTEAQQFLLENMEYPLIPILSRMEHAGVLVDRKALECLDRQWQERLTDLKQRAWDTIQQEFNLNSSQQLKTILFEDLGLKSTHKTPKGVQSTNEEALQSLIHQHPLIAIILEYRHYEKLRSTYSSSWLERLDLQHSRLHTTYDQTGTVTGRLSSFDPNLQNIPVRTPQGLQIRQTIIAPSGKMLVSFDYSQIELRLMAHFSQDPVLLQAYENDWDIHAQTASVLNHIDLATVTDEQRSAAKTVNFGLIYGMSAFGLAKQLGLSNAEAAQLIDQYFSTYKGVFEYMGAMRHKSKTQGYILTLMGRQIPVRSAVQKKGGDHSWRAAINGPLQGTASELIKQAMINLQPWILAHPGVEMVMQVHDELVFEVPVKDVEHWIGPAQHIMESAFKLRVPLKVHYSVGSCWE